MSDINESDIEDLERDALSASADRDGGRGPEPVGHDDIPSAPQVNAAALTQPTTNRRTRVNYTQAEIYNLLSIMERIVPCDSDEWQAVADEHASNFVRREVDALKKKFAQLHRRKGPTGTLIFLLK